MITDDSDEEYPRPQKEYWDQVKESDGFDLENVTISSPMYDVIRGLIQVDCKLYKRYPFPVLVNLYAKMGLHRYNMMEGTSFELDTLVKFNMLANCLSSFYMTLLAKDPAAGDLETIFQVLVGELTFGKLDLRVSIARIKDEQVTTKKPLIPHFYGGAAAELPDWPSDDDDFFEGELPDWPSDDDLNDGNRFYEVKESEWQSTGWISQYLELVICSHDKSILDRDVLSRLEIVRVAIETRGIQDVKEILKAKISAYVYIWFKGLAEPFAPRQVFKIGEHVERNAIVRRVMDEHTGDLTLLGKLYGGVMPPTDGEEAQTSKRPRLA